MGVPGGRGAAPKYPRSSETSRSRGTQDSAQEGARIQVSGRRSIGESFSKMSPTDSRASIEQRLCCLTVSRVERRR